MAKLFLDGIFKDREENDSPSAVYIWVPNPSSKLSTPEKPYITGLMTGDPSWGAANQWGPIINDVTNLTDISSLIGSDSMFSWINASTMCWKGTSPLTMQIEFFLINYKRGLELEYKLRSLTKLASLYQDRAASLGDKFKVLVHGGYAADIFTSNKKLFDSKSDDIKKLKNNPNGIIDKLNYHEGSAQGSVTVKFGHKSTIRNLLLSKINITESTTEVADSNGGDIKPLYYRVSATFTGVKPLLTIDVDSMFGGKGSSDTGTW